MTPPERDGWKFEVLGPVAVLHGGRAVHLGTPKARRILALLLGRPNRAVSVDVLVESLWADAPPRTAAKNVQVYIHHLRRALGDPERIVHQRPGYRLVVRSGELDAERFEDLARQGLATHDPQRASELFGQALALWTGDDAYADILDVPMIHAEVYRLAETRMTVLLNRIDADLRLGRHAELLPELTGLTAEHPLREGLWARLMTALYRCGRQADALGAYDNARRALVEQAGLDPGPELQELQRMILAASAESTTATAGHDHMGPAATPETAPAASAHEKPRTLPPHVADFTGRTAELEALEATLRHGRRIVAISGRGGIGKTALAVHLAHRLSDTFGDGQLYVHLAGAQPEPAEPAEVLSRFLRALGVANADLSEDADERASVYRSLLARRRILIVLDDAAGESQLDQLLPGSGMCAVIVTSRVRLGLPGADAIDLDVLPEDDGRRLLEKITGARHDVAASHELLGLCAGLPLAVRIMGAQLATRPHWRLTDVVGRLRDERHRLDALCYRDLAVRASFALSYQGLRPRAQQLFRLVGLIDAPDFAAWTATAAVDADIEETEKLLDEVIDARLLDYSDGRYRFHDLVRVYARERAEAEESDADRTAALTRAFGGWLALTDAAHRAAGDGVYAGALGGSSRWRPEIASAVFTPDSSMVAAMAESRALAAAVAQSARLGMHDICWELALGGVPIFQQGNFVDEWRATQECAFAACSAAGHRRGQAAMWYALGLLHGWHRQHDQARVCHERALELFNDLGDRHGSALVLRKLATAERFAGRAEKAIKFSRRAHDLLRELDDPGAAADALVHIGVVQLDLGNAAAAVETLAEAMRQARAVDAMLVLAQSAYWIGAAFIRLGRLEEAERSYGILEDFVRSVGSPTAQVYAQLGSGLLYLARGETDAARTRLALALTNAGEIRDPLMQARVLHALARALPSPAEACACLIEALEISERLRIPLLHAQLLEDLGRQHASRGEVTAARTAWTRALRLFRRIGSFQATDVAALLEELNAEPDQPVGESTAAPGSR
jgi:DNA-binding SARP family transcriptional activator